jgi:hypothetical protein
LHSKITRLLSPIGDKFQTDKGKALLTHATKEYVEIIWLHSTLVLETAIGHPPPPQPNKKPTVPTKWDAWWAPKLMFLRKEKFLPLSRYWCMIPWLSSPQSNNILITPAQIHSCWDWSCMTTTRIMMSCNANAFYILNMKQ